MCCLTNEEETYEELNSRLPSNGDHVTTPEGLKGDVQSVNVLRQQVKVIVTLDNDEKKSVSIKPANLDSSQNARRRMLNYPKKNWRS